VCHNCVQRRLARKADGKDVTPSAAAMRARRRDERRAAKGTTRPVDRLARLSRATRGEFTRSRRRSA
jgi:hypothetical protein